MPEDPHQSVGFWQELRRRRVGRTAVAYAAVAFAVLEISEVLLPALPLPDWSYRAVLGLAVLGFPLSVVLAWDFDVTSRGVVKTPLDATSDPGYAPGAPWGWLLLVSGAVVAGLAIRILGP